MGRSFIVVLTSILAAALHLAAQQQRPDNPFGSSAQDFGGIRTFLRAPYLARIEELAADVAVLGVPWDAGTSNRPGARYGPRDIREQSLNYAWARENGFFYIDGERTVLEGARWADLGDIDVRVTNARRTSELVTSAVRAVVAKGALPVVLGGDHSISFPVIRGLKSASLMVIHLDAHLDTYGDGDPNTLDHGGWVQQAARLPFVSKIVQAGMRGLANGAGGLANARKLGTTVITTEDIQRRGLDWTLAQIPAAENVYVSIDIDVLDPALAPGTGTAEVGGLTFRELSELLVRIPTKGRVVGFDVVEVNSFYDPTGVTAQTAARLIIDLVGSAFKR